MDNGVAVSFDHGYAATSQGSQGLTADRILVNIDKTVHPDLINACFAYVSVSRTSQTRKSTPMMRGSLEKILAEV
jgi:ATP-dependent exoDNAse (exonuclease V) alpha subunit